MKNAYAIRGGIAVIEIVRRNGAMVEVLVSTDNLPVAASVDPVPRQDIEESEMERARR